MVTQSFSSMKPLEPYGYDVTTSKLECVGYVQKHMGTRLFQLKLSMRKEFLNDMIPQDRQNNQQITE